MAMPGSPPPLPQVVVVGLEFCTPHPVDLTITRKAISLTYGDFKVTDVDGNAVFRVKGKLKLRYHRILFDAAGNPLLSMQEKIISAHKRWEVYRGDSVDPKDLVFTTKRSAVLQFKTELHVFLTENTTESVCDYKIKGSLFERSCTIYLGPSDIVVAEMKKHHTVQSVMLGKDAFCVTVSPNIDQAFIVALIILLDETNREI